jgi:hypothetical protein
VCFNDIIKGSPIEPCGDKKWKHYGECPPQRKKRGHMFITDDTISELAAAAELGEGNLSFEAIKRTKSSSSSTPSSQQSKQSSDESKGTNDHHDEQDSHSHKDV